MSMEMSRREAIAFGISALGSLSFHGLAQGEETSSILQTHDQRLTQALTGQVTDPKSRWCGGVPDDLGLHNCYSVGGLLIDMSGAYFHPQSKFFASAELLERMKLAVDFLKRSQSKDGNIDLLSANFNSPPDTAFLVHNVGTCARLAQKADDKSVLSLLEEFLHRAGHGLVTGGVHTPNHRWVVCAALAQINEVFPEDPYVQRIDQWLAEGIDIDAEGQYTERSTTGYNAVVDNALVVIALKLNRPELLSPVRQNLDAMSFLLHGNGEVVTEISERQDLNTRGTLSGYWFCLRTMALWDQNGLYASMLKPLEPDNISLPKLMEYPDLQKELPALTPIPEDYEKTLPVAGITRIRRGKTSATILHKGNPRWISLRHGEAVVNAVRFATAFFGRGQFSPTAFEKRGDRFCFTQELRRGYVQPLTDPALLPVRTDTWAPLLLKREETEVCVMSYEASIRETRHGFELVIEAKGTDGVPLALEVNLREGGEISGVAGIPGEADAFLLKEGWAEYRMGTDAMRFGPGRCEHSYVQIRRAEPKLPGPSIYLTGFTPFKHTLSFDLL